MLRTEDLLVLGEALRPPDGYNCDALMAWSYSLDLGMALALPLSFLRGRNRAGEDPADVPPWDLVEALRARPDDFRIFCDARSIYAPAKAIKHLLLFLQSIVVPVAMPQLTFRRRPSFHPKLVIARYKASGKPTRMRAVCMSRNLTTGGSLDVSVAIDGDSQADGSAQGGGDLADAVETVAGWATAATDTTTMFAKGLAADVRACGWHAPAPFTSVRFVPLGFSRGHGDPALLREGENRILVVSPFLHPGRLEALTETGANHILISERGELRTVAPDLLASCFASVKRLSGEGIGHAGLHAKFYICEGARQARWLVGSANATKAAVTRNAELLVELIGPADKVGIERTLDDGLAELVTEFQPGDVQERSEATALEDALDELATRVFRADVVSSDAEVMNVRIVMGGGHSLDQTVTVRFAAGKNEANFDKSGAAILRASLRELSTFLVISIPAASPPLSRTVVAELVGVSLDDLKREIRRELVPDPMTLLLALIAGAEDTLLPMLDFDDAGYEGAASASDPASGAVSGQQVLEPLLRLVRDDGDDDGRRLDDLQARFEELREDLDSDFVEMWDAVMRARLS